MLSLRSPPRLHSEVLSHQEGVLAQHLWFLLHMLDRYLHHFDSAVQLFDYATIEIRKASATYSVVGGWPFIAARDCAMGIYHFEVSLYAIRGQVQECPTLRQFHDAKTMRQAIKLFRGQFANAKNFRHAVAHSADNIATPDAVVLTMQGKTRRGSPKMLNIENIKNRRFETTYDGELLSFDVSEATLDKLVQIRDLAISALMPVDFALSRLQGPPWRPESDKARQPS